MFKLDAKIAEWRSQMAASGLKTHKVLDELESHLRDDVEQQVGAGTDMQKAFEAAVARIGKPSVLQHEFEKVGARKVAFRPTLKVFVCLALIASIALLSTNAFVGVQMSLAAKILGCLVVTFLLSAAWARRAAFLFGPVLPNSADAKQVLESARDEAIAFHHDFLGTEHLLLGLIKRREEADVFHRLGLDVATVRSEIERQVGLGPEEMTHSSVPYTPRAKRALALASNEAKAMNRPIVTPEHLLLGLLLEGDGVAARVLQGLGVRPERARAEILKTIDPNLRN